MRKRIVSLCLVGLAGCASLVEELEQALPQEGTQLIQSHSLLSDMRVNGGYQLAIKAGRRQGQFVYLNTHEDHRDPKNITVTLAPDIAKELSERYESLPEAFFVNKTIRVDGEVRHVKMWHYEGDRRTNKYFYQTRIQVRDPANISL